MNLKTWKHTGDTFNWRNQEVFYQHIGEGEAVFLLHGFITSSWDWHLVWEELSKRFHLFAPDFIGFGYSSKPINYPYSYDERADLIYDLAALHGIKEMHIIARSFSVSLAQEMIRRQNENQSPTKIKSVCFLNGRLFSWSGKIAFNQRILLSPFGKWIGPLYNRNTVKRSYSELVGKFSKFPEHLIDDYYALTIFNKGKRIIHRLNKYWLERKEKGRIWEKAMIETDIPIQLIWGIDEDDDVGGMKTVHYYRELISEKYIVMLKDIGHFPNIECPEAVVDYYFRFTEGIQSGKMKLNDD